MFGLHPQRTAFVLAVIAVIIGTVLTVDVCPFFCPTHCTCNDHEEPDPNTLSLPQWWMFTHMFTYKYACTNLCEFKWRCIPPPSSAAASSQSETPSMTSNMLALLPDENKTVWLSNGQTVMEPLLLEHGWEVQEEIDPAKPPTMAFFVRRRFARRFVHSRDRHLLAQPSVNYIGASNVITEKYNLARVLRSYAVKTGDQSALQLQPRTYLLNDRDECTKFFTTVAVEAKEKKEIWLLKASSLSRGQGIVIYDDLSKVRDWFLQPPSSSASDSQQCREDVVDGVDFFTDDGRTVLDHLEDNKGNKQNTNNNKNDPWAAASVTGEKGVQVFDDQLVVAQQYVTNPLLLKGKKMEIRTYWLVASLDPLIALYHDGTVRRTTTDYKAGDWNDPLIHISNTYQQKLADPNYHETQDERKWTVQQLEEYLLSEEGRRVVNVAKPDEILKPGWFNTTLRRQLKSIISTVLRASIHDMRNDRKNPSPPYAWSLMGMDTILDDTLRPYLTEIQVGPGLSMDDAVKKRLIKPMATEAFNIALEVAYRKKNGMSLFELDSVHNFEFIVNEASGFDVSNPTTNVEKVNE